MLIPPIIPTFISVFFLLSISSLTLKLLFAWPSSNIAPENRNYLTSYMEANGYEFTDSWLLVQGSDYQILKYKPVNKMAHCAKSMLIIDMHHSAELIAMLENSISEENEELIYLYKGLHEQQCPQFQV